MLRLLFVFYKRFKKINLRKMKRLIIRTEGNSPVNSDLLSLINFKEETKK